MYILLFIVGEIASVIGTSVIAVKTFTDPILKIQKNGYKLDPKVVEKVQKENKSVDEVLTKADRIKAVVTLLAPGVNLLFAGYRYLSFKHAFEKNEEIKGCLTPMTEEEKEYYSKLNNNIQRIEYFAMQTVNEEDTQFFGFAGNRPIVVDHGLHTLYSDELEPIGYTLEDVKKLNDVYGYSYRIGTIDGKNVAVIGIPNPDSQFKRVQFKADKGIGHHDYIKMTEEEAQDKTFAVYDFYDDKKEEINNVIEEIKKSRIEEFDRIYATQEELPTITNEKTEDKGPVLTNKKNK